MNRKILSALCSLLAVTLAFTALAQQPYPAKPVRVLVPYAPGGGADTLARILFGELTTQFGQQFVIDNRGGGSGVIGASLVSKATPDGYVILHDATGFSINPGLLPKHLTIPCAISSPCSWRAGFRICWLCIRR